jgi:hypothetical protein
MLKLPYEKREKMKRINYVKTIFTFAMAVYGIVCARDVTVLRFLDRVDLIAHEAGHLFFSWFGEFMQVAGGTIGQLFIPIAFTVYFFFRKELFSASVTFFWVGRNLFNISLYVKDAQTMALPLVSVGGGEDTIHDWNYLLSHAGLLRWDRQVGSLVYGLGLLVTIASVIMAGHWSIDRSESE